MSSSLILGVMKQEASILFIVVQMLLNYCTSF